MNPTVSNDWLAANQRHLMTALALIRHALDHHAESGNPKCEIRNPKETRSSKSEDLGPERIEESTSPTETAIRSSDLQNTPLAEAALALDIPSSLQTLGAAFGLSPFERDVLLLCAGCELDGSFAACCAAAQGDPRRVQPTFSLALAALPGAHWSALLPSAPLRRWRLIEVGAGDVLTNAPLRIDERVLHFLTGLDAPDARLHGIVRPVGKVGPLAPSQLELARRVALAWQDRNANEPPPVIQLCGPEGEDKRALAAHVSTALKLRLRLLRAADVSSVVSERVALVQLWQREAVLSSAALLVTADDGADAERTRELLAFLQDLETLVFLSRHEPLELPLRASVRFDVPKPGVPEQKALWTEALGEDAAALNGQLDRLTAQFSLGAQTIRVFCAELRRDFALVGGASVPASQPEPPHAPAREDARPTDPVSAASAPLETRLWQACRARTRPRLDELAQRLTPAASWDDLVLPTEQRRVLGEIAAQVRQRFTVYERWGFAARGARGLGITALFSGPSGTGKTMAAEVLAGELKLDLYRIDLSSAVSKYIGETEKNLRRIFDAAEDSGVVLLFDEADALFGKRSEVKDSHDRYANIEVSYLLQRMEAYRGLAILTTNFQNALDTAFLRRIRFVVQFPFPDAPQRAEIWRRIFPAATPTDALNMERLSSLNVAGGHIRNIALNAAFLAADEAAPVRMGHVLRAARTEYAKLEKPLTDTEVKGWL